MENEYYQDSPNIYLGFSNLSSEEYDEEKKKYITKSKRNMLTITINKKQKQIFKQSINHNKASNIQEIKTNTKNKIDMADFFNEMTSFPFNENIKITKKPIIAEQQQQDVYIILNNIIEITITPYELYFPFPSL